MFRLKRIQDKAIKSLQNIYSRKFSSSHDGPSSYSLGQKTMHWIQAFGFCGITTTGYIASGIDPKKATEDQKKLKGNLMHYHKSFALLMFAAIFPRIYFRLKRAVPAHLPATSIEILAGSLMHYSLYGMIIIMPVTGICMGWYSGFGVPFFKWHLPGAPKEKTLTEDYKQKRVWVRNTHKQFVKVLEYLIPIHIGAVGFAYVARGQNLLRRMNPFRR